MPKRKRDTVPPTLAQTGAREPPTRPYQGESVADPADAPRPDVPGYDVLGPLIVQDGFVYWLGDDLYVHRCATSGCGASGPTTVVKADTFARITGFAVTDVLYSLQVDLSLPGPCPGDARGRGRSGGRSARCS